MKKITLIAAAFIAVSFASCSKAKTCTCTTSTTKNGVTQTTTEVTSYDKISSGDANAVCPKTTTSTGSGDVKSCVLS